MEHSVLISRKEKHEKRKEKKNREQNTKYVSDKKQVNMIWKKLFDR